MRRARIAIAAVLLGIGLGGFFDGIVFREILQWHSMLSAAVPPESMDAVKTNMAAEGWFHLALWLVTLGGVRFLWSALRAPGRTPSSRAFAGYLLIGWGGFNLVEGLLNHFILELHHVRDFPTHIADYDWAFLAAGGIGLLLLGLALRDMADPGPVSSERRSGYERRGFSLLR